MLYQENDPELDDEWLNANEKLTCFRKSIEQIVGRVEGSESPYIQGPHPKNPSDAGRLVPICLLPAPVLPLSCTQMTNGSCRAATPPKFTVAKLWGSRQLLVPCRETCGK